VKVERSVEIAAAPEAVYEVVMNPRRLTDWVTVHARLHGDPPKQLKEGSELVQSIKVAGQKFKVEWHVVKAEKPSSVQWDGRGPMGTKARVKYELEEQDGGTLFHYVNEYDFPGGPLGRLGAKAFERTAGKEADKTLETLKGLLER
jgi:carbon monoxide dehydrogenase subunit G